MFLELSAEVDITLAADASLNPCELFVTASKVVKPGLLLGLHR